MINRGEGEDRVKGILWMLFTYFGFVLMDAIVKYAMQTLPLIQTIWGRFFFATIVTAGIAGKVLPQIIKTKAPKVQFLRSVLMMITTALFYTGLARVPMATAATVMYLSPILVTLLSILILREQVGWRRWFGIGIGFLGAFIIVDPLNATGPDAFNKGAVFLVFAALSNASYQVTTRYLRHDDPMTTLLFTAVAGTLVTSIIVPWFWVWPSASEWGLLIIAGLFGAITHFCLIRAFSYAPASVVAPFSYSSLIWAVIFGLAIWGEWPKSNTWIGAALIITAGLYIFVRERRLKT